MNHCVNIMKKPQSLKELREYLTTEFAERRRNRKLCSTILQDLVFFNKVIQAALAKSGTNQRITYGIFLEILW